MALLAVSVVVVLIISAVCSVAEAALYAVRMSYVRSLKAAGGVAGRVLYGLKKNMERPISAILIVNTAANTAGAAVAGAQADALLGHSSVVWFSICFTLAVLVFAEILPKIVGVAYNTRLAAPLAIPLEIVTRLLFPLVWSVQHLSHLVKPEGPVFAAPEEEVHQMALMSAEEGSILPLEAELVRNVLKLNEVTAAEVMTPRSVVFRLRSGMTLREVAEKIKAWPYSRIPIYDEDDQEMWTGIVLRRDVLSSLANDRYDEQLQALSKPIHFVASRTPCHVLLQSFIRRRTHLFGVVDQHGLIVGIVTLEDVMESLLGREIVDETDAAIDMQEVARLRHREQFGGPSEDEEGDGRE